MKSRITALFATSVVLSAVAIGIPSAAQAADTPGLPGKHNAITDVPGIHVGQVQNTQAPYLTGTTVIYTPTMSVASVDQRGGAPATKETDLLNPLNSNPGVNAIMLGGSSMYGLAASDGVVRWLEERGEGIRVGSGVAPIVPAADIFDLGRGGNFKARTTAEWGYLAAAVANNGPVAQGVVGGGAGASAGGIKGGVGTASVVLEGGIYVGAIVVVNSAGSTINSKNCALLAAQYELAGEYRGLKTPKDKECHPPAAAAADEALNTTIAIVATNAPLEKAAAARMASNAHDGMARAINPIHTLGDGDTIFAVSTGTGTPLRVNNPTDGRTLNSVFNAATNTLARAIGHAMISSTSVGSRQSYCDRYPSACKGMKAKDKNKMGTAPNVTAESLGQASAKVSTGVAPVVNNGGGVANAPAVGRNSDDSREVVALTTVGFNGGNGPPALLAFGLLAAAGLAGALRIRRRKTSG